MNLWEIHKKGIYRISKINDSSAVQCLKYGLSVNSIIIMTEILTDCYRLILVDDRLIALPSEICRGIEV